MILNIWGHTGDLCIAFLVFSALQSALCCIHTFFFNHTNTWNTRGKFGFRYLDKEKNVHFFKTSNYFSLFSLQSVKIITLSYYYIYNICALLDKPAKPDRQYASTKLNIFFVNPHSLEKKTAFAHFSWEKKLIQWKNFKKRRKSIKLIS